MTYLDFVFYYISNKYYIRKYLITAVVAERLRRLTRNQIPSWSVGSNPTDCDRNTFVSFTFSKFLFVVRL